MRYVKRNEWRKSLRGISSWLPQMANGRRQRFLDVVTRRIWQLGAQAGMPVLLKGKFKIAGRMPALQGNIRATQAWRPRVVL